MKFFFDTINKNLLKVFLFFTIVCQFSMVFASDKIFADGGTSGGGGNVSISPLINKDKLKQFIKMSIPYQKQIFTVSWYFDGERITPKKKGLSNVYAKLFHAKKTIYDVLDQPPKFTFQEYPCIDPKTGQPVHSSALIDQNEICFDINSLSQILTENTYIRKILALISHELSHFVIN